MKALPCPFCSRPIDVDDIDTLYPSGIGWEDGGGGYRHYVRSIEVPREQWCWKIVCQEHSGGCGAEISGDSIPETIRKWNRRSVLAGAHLMSDKGYEIGTQSGYDEFVRTRQENCPHTDASHNHCPTCNKKWTSNDNT
jgi:hypothetical protein